jgi:hypothetical protein
VVTCRARACLQDEGGGGGVVTCPTRACLRDRGGGGGARRRRRVVTWPFSRLMRDGGVVVGTAGGDVAVLAFGARRRVGLVLANDVAVLAFGARRPWVMGDGGWF